MCEFIEVQLDGAWMVHFAVPLCLPLFRLERARSASLRATGWRASHVVLHPIGDSSGTEQQYDSNDLHDQWESRSHSRNPSSLFMMMSLYSCRDDQRVHAFDAFAPPLFLLFL